MDFLALVAALTVMAAVVSALVALYQVTANPRAKLERRLGSVLGESTGFNVTPGQSEALRPKRAGRLPIFSALLEGRAWAQEMAADLERSDLRFTVGEWVAIRIFLGLLGAAMALLLLGGLLSLIAAIGLVFAGATLPMVYLGMAKKRRVNRLNGQLGEALTMMANSLKAGFGLLQSMDMVAKELQHPIATEIRRTIQDINVGSTTEVALQTLAKRCGSADLDIVITAMLIQQSTGGNLSEILEGVGHTMRERVRIRGEIATLTTQQVMTGVIIGALPFFIGGFISMSNPDYIRPLFSELVGQLMLGGALVLELFGIILIKRILDIEV